MGDNDHEIAALRRMYFQQAAPVLGGTYFKSNYLNNLFSPGFSLGPAMYSSAFKSPLNKDYSPLKVESNNFPLLNYSKASYSPSGKGLDYITNKYQ